MLQPSDGKPENICPLCNGTGWKPAEASNLGGRVTRCDCWRESVTRRLLSDARIPRRYHHCTLNDFITYDNETLEEALVRSRKLADAFPVVERGLFFLGEPGVGKTHLAVGLGLKAIEHGYRVLFTTAAVLIAALTRALAEGRLDDKLKVYTVPRLLIVDEIGYLPIDRQGANLFFQLISRRYERGPMIL